MANFGKPSISQQSLVTHFESQGYRVICPMDKLTCISKDYFNLFIEQSHEDPNLIIMSTDSIFDIEGSKQFELVQALIAPFVNVPRVAKIYIEQDQTVRVAAHCRYRGVEDFAAVADEIIDDIKTVQHVFLRTVEGEIITEED